MATRGQIASIRIRTREEQFVEAHLRGYFAAAALGWWGPAGMINRIDPQGAADDCYRLADAMLKAREKVRR
jgi:hypothetical protein